MYKLWLAHGVTAIRDPGSGNGVDWTLRSRERSAKNEIVAPRVFVYVRPGSGWDGGRIETPEKARDYVRWAARRGVDGFKLGSHDPAVMAALTIAQDEKGWIAKETVEFVAAYLGMQPIAVWEVATFYGMYNLEPIGRHKIVICTNLPCALQGANVAAEHLKKKLGVGFNETTADGRFTLKEGECFGACGDAPVFLHNNKRMLCAMGRDQLDELLKELD